MATANMFLFNPIKHTQKLDDMVSISQITTFLKCPRAWLYTYGERLQKRVDRPYLTIGKLCHKGMEAAWRYVYENQAPVPDAPPMSADVEYLACDAGIVAIAAEYDKYMSENTFLEEEIPMQEQILRDSMAVFRHAWYEFEPRRYRVVEVMEKRVRVPAIELHFVIPCHGSKGLHGLIDVVLEEIETGYIWCTDYKFRRSLSPDEEEATNIQNLVYSHVMHKMGYNVTGTMTWQHLNTPPAIPATLKDPTKVSRAKIKTDWGTYAAYVESIGGDPAEYEEEMVPKLAEIVWSHATKETRNELTMGNAFDTIIHPTAYNISSSHKLIAAGQRESTRWKRRFAPCMFPWNCKTCGHLELCQAELRGYDADFIKKTEYKKRPTAIERMEAEREEELNETS